MRPTIRFHIDRHPINSASIKIYLYERGEEVKFYYVKDGLLEHQEETIPLLDLDYDIDEKFEDQYGHGILQALSDALGRIGIYPQATNKDKIKAESIADERKEQIEYLRKIQERMIFE